MDIPASPIHVPGFSRPNLRGGTVDTAQLRGRVLLIDFWDYTCVNCLRTLPYVEAWSRKYRAQGLSVIGIHTPEFSFARDPQLVADAAGRFDLSYPIVLDNDYQLWQAFANRCWPAKYLVNGQGYIRVRHWGEGGYEEMERAIRELLLELSPARAEALPTELVRLSASPVRDGAACLPCTRELYLGYQRGQVVNAEDLQLNTTIVYQRPTEQPLDTVALEGEWHATPEFLGHVGGEPASILLHYQAAEVNIVLAPLAETPATVQLLIDGKPLPAGSWGEDVRERNGAPIVSVDLPRMYRLLRHEEMEEHLLELRTSSPGLAGFAFTFGACG